MKKTFNYFCKPISYSIYSITCNTSGKVYIGKTTQHIRHRFRAHINAALRGRTTGYLANAIRKYGEQNLKLELIEKGFAPEAEAYRREMHFISVFSSIAPNGLNMNAGGKGGAASISDATRQKKSQIMKGNIPWNKGKKLRVCTDYPTGKAYLKRKKQCQKNAAVRKLREDRNALWEWHLDKDPISALY